MSIETHSMPIGEEVLTIYNPIAISSNGRDEK
jgi:hypothetical protein